MKTFRFARCFYFVSSVFVFFNYHCRHNVCVMHAARITKRKGTSHVNTHQHSTAICTCKWVTFIQSHSLSNKSTCFCFVLLMVCCGIYTYPWIASSDDAYLSATGYGRAAMLTVGLWGGRSNGFYFYLPFSSRSITFFSCCCCCILVIIVCLCE